MRIGLIALVASSTILAASPAAGQERAGGFAPGLGFWVGDPRGMAILRTSLQPRYACESTFEGDEPCDAGGFGLRRARVRLGLVIADPSAELALQADLADPDQPLEEAYALVRPWVPVRIAAGRMRVPVTREGLYAEELLPLAEPSPLTLRVQPRRDLGILAGVRMGRFDATVGAWNGAPDAFENDNVDLLYAARMSIDLVGAGPVAAVRGDPSPIAREVPGAIGEASRFYAAFAVAGLFDLPRSSDDAAGDPANSRVQAVVADLTLRWRAWSLDMAGGLREEDRGALEEPDDVERTLGASATLGWALPSPRIVPALRWTLLQDHPVEGESALSWQLAAAASWRIGAPDLLTILLEYDLEHREGEAALHRGLAELRIVL